MGVDPSLTGVMARAEPQDIANKPESGSAVFLVSGPGSSPAIGNAHRENHHRWRVTVPKKRPALGTSDRPDRLVLGVHSGQINMADHDPVLINMG
jgi:hypothetical protein